jgi:predicted nucleic acid-binding protein
LIIYLDACAVVKLIRREEHSGALAEHLASAGANMISSELTRVEVCRTLIRDGQRESTRAKSDQLLNKIAKLPVGTIIDLAGDLPHRNLRTLDALHMATAQMLGPAVTEFITYDKRLAKAAEEAGLPLVMPGVN